MPNNLLVTLANEEYLDGAKQVFGSAYFKGGWDGDMMLLAYDVPEEKLKWFRERGILVRMCDGQSNIGYEKIGRAGYSVAIRNKFVVFLPEFKRWKKIIFLDADVIVRSSLCLLTKAEEFSAVSHYISFKDEIYNYQDKVFAELINKYDMNSDVFNSGMFVLPTKIIDNNTFNNISNFFYRYGTCFDSPDEPALNMFFYKEWKKLSCIYNINVSDALRLGMSPKFIDGCILHFVGPVCPWNESNPFYSEWKENLNLAYKINSIPPDVCLKNFFVPKIYLSYFRFINYLDFIFGNIGNLIKSRNTFIYFYLKKFFSYFWDINNKYSNNAK